MADRKSGAGVTERPDGAPDATGLTPRQLRVLAHIKDSIEKRGYPPSMREIGQAVGLTSTSSVAHQLRTLEEKGYLKRDPNRPRALEVFLPEVMAARRAMGNAEETTYDETGIGDAAPTPANVPVVGRIAAGGPILAEERVEDIFPLPRQLVGDGQLFLLQVAGESMVDGQDLPAQGRSGLAAPPQPGLRPHRRHPCDDPRQGHRRASAGVSPLT